MNVSESFSFLVLIHFFFCTNHASLEIIAGLDHNCIYEPGQTGMQCWGRNHAGQLGYEDANNRGDNAGEMGANLPIVDLGPDFTVNTTGLGGFHSCAVSQGHAVKCWGWGNRYQTGNGKTDDLGDEAGEMGTRLAVVRFSVNFVPLKVAGGGWHSCVLSTDARLVCFGYNWYGECGAGTSDTLVIGAPSRIADVDLGSNFTPVDISVFLEHVCALSQQQTIKCFGRNDDGQLGYGDKTHRGTTPQSMGDGLLVLSLGSNFTPKAVAVGGSHTCALSTLKTVKCFGDNRYGQCGQATPGGSNSYIGDAANEMADNLPVLVFPDGFVPMQMALGSYHTCILSESAQVVCFGYNYYSQLGLGHTTHTTSPTLVDLGTDFIPRKLAVGAYHTCAVSTVNTVKCWGKNDYGQLGLGHTNNMGGQANAMGDDLQVVGVCLGVCTAAPTTAAPTTNGTSAVPTTAPTSAAPSTAAPSTAAPVTTSPTTAAPTISVPTAAPTTATPTTVTAPTTVAAPTTAAPTTTAPTTATPTITTTTDPQTTHNNSNHTVTVTIRTDSLSSTQVLVAIANAHNLSSTLLTITTLSSEDERDDGFATVELLVAVPSNVELDYDVIEATLREAMVDEYGDDIQVDIDVHGDDDEGDAQSSETSAFSWGMWVVAILGSIVVCVCCVAAVGLVYVRRQRNKNAVNVPPPQPAAAAVPPPLPPQQIANIHCVSALAMTRLVSQSVSQVVPGAAAADDHDDERKQGEEDVELQMASQEEAKAQPFVYDENRNYKKEGARASLVTATAGNHNDDNNRTSGDTIGATVGNDPNLGVYELNQMVDL